MDNINLSATHYDYISGLKNRLGNSEVPFSIENGYFIFTLMPSLRCSLNCPHCYLSLDQRRNSPIMDLDSLKIACEKVDEYYKKMGIKNKVLIFYWYGGEPTEMGIDYFTKATNIINFIFKKEEGYVIKHTVLTSLLTIDENIWFKFFRENCDNHFQTSFDGLMRGKVYVKKWEEKVRLAKKENLEVGTISVVNNELLKDGATKIMDYLSGLGVKEVSFLPFMWNEQNDGKSYNKFAPSMMSWSEFMIEASKYYFDVKKNGKFTPEIGQLSFIIHQAKQPQMANIAAQTLFLLPNGDFVLPDYKNGYQEYMRVFGNILKQDFADVLRSTERRSYLRKQVLRNNNKECLACDHADKCVMEFWKDNKPNDDCFGGSVYINWLLDYIEKNNILLEDTLMY